MRRSNEIMCASVFYVLRDESKMFGVRWCERILLSEHHIHVFTNKQIRKMKNVQLPARHAFVNNIEK